MTRRTAARVDDNQTEIVAALRAIGCSVLSLAELGDGCPDLLVGVAKINVLIEVKDKLGRFTPAQKDFHATWRGRAHVVRSVDEALYLIDSYRKALASVNR